MIKGNTRSSGQYDGQASGRSDCIYRLLQRKGNGLKQVYLVS